MSFTEERRGATGKLSSRQAFSVTQNPPGARLSSSRRHLTLTRLLARLAVVLLGFVITATPMAVPVNADDPPTPSITLSPDRGVPGTVVTVRGYDFSPNQWVDIYYYIDSPDRIRVAEIQLTSATAFTTTFDVPESYSGNHEVRAIGQYDAASENFRVTQGLTVSPTEGPVGTTVIVQGRGYGRNEAGIEIRFDGELVADGIAANVAGSWDESIVVPSAAGGAHTIRSQGAVSSTATFDVKPGIMLDKSAGWPDQTVTMTGNAFAANERHIRILFDGEELPTDDIRADEKGYWQESFDVPEMPAGTYTITAAGDRTRSTDLEALSFSITPGLVLSPVEGHVGMNLTVAGHGFASNEDVTISYDDSEVDTGRTDEHGSFEVVFIVPESRSGDREVRAQDDSDNEGTAIFTMESDPPDTPEPISPRDQSKAGFVGSVRPRFQWSKVEDPSGVYYRLQISASANVTGTGEFADPMISIERLLEEHYTLNKTDALSYGTYYWIVQAVDRAENAGNWTAPYSFRAGLLPVWAFIAIIVGVVLLAGGLVYFLVVRRRMYY